MQKLTVCTAEKLGEEVFIDTSIFNFVNHGRCNTAYFNHFRALRMGTLSVSSFYHHGHTLQGKTFRVTLILPHPLVVIASFTRASCLLRALLGSSDLTSRPFEAGIEDRIAWLPPRSRTSLMNASEPSSWTASTAARFSSSPRRGDWPRSFHRQGRSWTASGPRCPSGTSSF